MADYADAAGLDRLAEGAAALTFEFENVPAAALEHLAQGRPELAVRPGAVSLTTAQDRLAEKRLFHRLGIPTPGFAAVSDRRSLGEAGERLGYPFILKTRRLGYDGKGQFRFEEADDLDRLWAEAEAALAASSAAVRRSGGDEPEAGGVAESFVAFDRELSVVLVRSAAGEVAAYPIPENSHDGGILRVSVAPAPELPRRLADQAIRDATRLADCLDHVGVLCLELFERGDQLLANEFAPRVHNSGHWSIEGCRTSQFENHVRAVLGLPLGRTGLRPGVGCAAMVNVIGRSPGLEALLEMERVAPTGAAVFTHVYGKSAKPGRKLGHVTVVGEDREGLAAGLEAVLPVVVGGG